MNIEYLLAVMLQMKYSHNLLEHIFANVLFPGKNLSKKFSELEGLPCLLILSETTFSNVPTYLAFFQQNIST
jgi:hypothetical protein